jgi:murein DD-endopeptidase MepM/ murein hydrolase activator NlpD
VDLNATTGTPVTSVGPGRVTSAGYDGSYGNKIVVEHADGTETWYCHLSAINVSVGQAVTHETVIGLVGATGNVTGDHLHLELRPAGGGDPVDPVAGLAAAHGVHL